MKKKTSERKSASEMKRILARLKEAQEKLRKLVGDRDLLVAETRKYVQQLAATAEKRSPKQVARLRAIASKVQGELAHLQKEYVKYRQTARKRLAKIRKLTRKTKKPS